MAERTRTPERTRILVVGDPLAALKPASDTSLALAQAAVASGREVHWCEPGDVAIVGADVAIRAPRALSRISSEGFSHDALPNQPGKGQAPGGIVALSSYEAVLVRKDPPFDEAYKTLCWILASQTATRVLNAPERLLAHHEKALPFRARAEGVLRDYEVVPTCVTSNTDIARAFVEDYAANAKTFVESLGANDPNFAAEMQAQGGLGWIVKPWLGHGGYGVQAFATGSEALAFLARALVEKQGGEKTWMLQPFLPQIKTHGDRRVFVVKGEIVCDFVRLPAQGRIAANLAQGGSAVLRPFTPAQRDVAERIARWLASIDIAVAGVDLVDTFVGEINVTSPTGLRTYESLTGTNISAHALELLLGRA